MRLWTFDSGLGPLIESHGGTILTNKGTIARLIVDTDVYRGECSTEVPTNAEKGVLSTIHIKHLGIHDAQEAVGRGFLSGVETWESRYPLFATTRYYRPR